MNGVFVGIDHDPLLVQHENVHGQPLGGHPQWVVCGGTQGELRFTFLNK